jgi:hypothetical protein
VSEIEQQQIEEIAEFILDKVDTNHGETIDKLNRIVNSLSSIEISLDRLVKLTYESSPRSHIFKNKD